MNKIKHMLLALALVSSLAPAKAIDKQTVAAGAACAVAAGGVAYCAYQWYTESCYWTVRLMTKEVENVLKTNLSQFDSKLHWDHKLQLHGLRHRSFTRNQAEIVLTLNLENGQWHVRSIQLTAGLEQKDIKNPGRLTIRALYNGAENVFIVQNP